MPSKVECVHTGREDEDEKVYGAQNDPTKATR